MHLDFKIPTKNVNFRKLRAEIAAVAIPLRNFKFIDRLAASCIRIPTMKRAVDMDSYQLAKEMDADESSNRARALLTRVSLLP